MAVRISVVARQANSQAKDYTGENHPYQGDDGDRFREATQEPRTRNKELVATEDSACNGNAIGHVCRGGPISPETLFETARVKRLQGPMIASVKIALIAASSANARAPKGIEKPTMSQTAEEEREST